MKREPWSPYVVYPSKRRDKCAAIYENMALEFWFQRCYPSPPIPEIYCNMASNIVLFSLCLNKLSHGKLHFRNLNGIRMCGFHANHTSSSFVSYAFIYSYHQHIRTEHHKCFLYVQVVRGLGRSKQILSSLSFKSIKRHEYHSGECAVGEVEVR